MYPRLDKNLHPTHLGQEAIKKKERLIVEKLE